MKFLRDILLFISMVFTGFSVIVCTIVVFGFALNISIKILRAII